MLVMLLTIRRRCRLSVRLGRAKRRFIAREDSRRSVRRITGQLLPGLRRRRDGRDVLRQGSPKDW